MFRSLASSLTATKVIERCLVRSSLAQSLPSQTSQVRSCSSKTKPPKFGSRPKGDNSRYGFVNWQQKKDFHRRECVRDHFAERLRINTIRKNRILPVEIREVADVQAAELPRDSNPNRVISRCVYTSRPRGVRTKHRASRIVFRDFIDHGQLPGYTRSCW